ncbi:copper resistance CopC family protein [Actinomadura scrupuli]|uniref:copper resistance CopC family protein n=1 Tax=Actinomadura scrupuli TaxID=559629 RepID=UPI003D980E9E
MHRDLACRGATLTAGLAASVAVVAPSAAAAAHAELKTMSPGHGSVQASAPSEVVLTFDQPVSRRFTAVEVIGPAGARVESGPPTVDRAVVRQPLRPLPPPGRYRVAYRTVSVDGHVVRGAREFTFRPPEGAPSPTVSASRSPAPAAPQPARREASSGPPWAQLGLAAVVTVLLAVTVLALRRGRRDG